MAASWTGSIRSCSRDLWWRCMPSRSPADRPRIGVALLGSTGSIGRQAVEVLEAHADRFRVAAIATGSNAGELEAQAHRLRPAAVALAADGAPIELPAGIHRVTGDDALVELATRDDVDLVVIGTGGVVSLRPTLAALRHPTWTMGAKITIDSATLANKGLEVIEAHWLYDVPYDVIDVVVHPQSVVHSAVLFVDGSLKAQLGTPDMRLPIQYALTHPDRLPSPATPPDLVAAARLDFRAPDEKRFPALRIAREAGLAGPRASAALIAADEVAVARFLHGSLDFPGI